MTCQRCNQMAGTADHCPKCGELYLCRRCAEVHAHVHPKGRTALDEAKRIAAAYGFPLDDDTADAIIWEQTGFPVFWPDISIPAHWNFRRQLREFFAEAKEYAEAGV